MRYVTNASPVAAALEGAQRVGKVLGAVRWTGFFRDASGPGWVLVGDAGHHKDPAPDAGSATRSARSTRSRRRSSPALTAPATASTRRSSGGTLARQ